MLQISLTSHEYEHADYTAQIKRATRDEDIAADTPLNRIRNCSLLPFFDEVRGIKAALFLKDWIEQAAVCDIENQYATSAGQVLSAADQVGWLLDATAALATALGCAAEFVDRLRLIAERVQYGVSAELAPLARLALASVSRNGLAELAARGLHQPRKILGTPIEVLTEWMDPADARRLKDWAAKTVTATADSDADPKPVRKKTPVLVVDEKRPGEILLDGARIRLQEKQYRLICVLSALPGECIPYETIYKMVWGETIVEPNQMHFQKRKLIESIMAHLPDRAQVVTTVPKRGFMLNLTPDQVAFRPIKAA